VSLWDNQIGYVDESTYGTRVVPTRFLEFDNEAVVRNQINREGAGLRAGKRVQRVDHQSQANKGAGGKVAHELRHKGFGLLLKHCVGKAAVLSQPSAGPDPTVWDQVFTLGDSAGLSMTAQIGRPETVDRVVKPFDYVGVKVADWTISQDLDAYTMLEMTLDAMDEITSQTLATASYPAFGTIPPFNDGGCSVLVNSLAYLPSKLSLTCNNGIKTDRYSLRADTRKREPLAGNALATLTGTMSGEFEAMTNYAAFVAGTIVPIVLKWEGPIISNAFKYTFQITLANCRIDGETPQTGGLAVPDQNVPFTVLDDGATAPISILYRSTDVAS
jgi:hypothetical protein